jgi:hypothetical protein
LTAIISIDDHHDKLQVYDVFDAKYLMEFADDEVQNDEIIVDTHRVSLMTVGMKNPGIKFKGKYHVMVSDDDISRSL